MPLSEDRDGTLSAFRGLEFTRPSGSDPKLPAAFVDKIFQDCRVGSASPLKAAIEAWAGIVGPKYAPLSEPADMGKTVLYVRVFNSAARQELAFMERPILKKIAALGGCAAIRKVKFI